MNHPPDPQSAIRNPQSKNPQPQILRALPFILVCALYVGARLWRLTESCLWFDEVFGVHAARQTWGELWGFVAADLIHPPLFYALLKLWTAAGGESLLWLRLFAVAAAVAAVAPLLLLARELRLGRAATLLALLLAAASGFLIKYAQEVRMYALLLLLTLTSLWLFARYLNAARGARRPLLALALVNLLLVYTHYYGWLVIISECAFLFGPRARGRLKPFALTVAAIALCFAPWVFACAAAAREGGGLAQNIGWIARPGPADAARFYVLLQQPFYFQRSSDESPAARATTLAVLLLFALPVTLLLARARQRSETDDGRPDDAFAGPDDGAGAPASPSISSSAAVTFLLFFSVAPLALAFAASWALPHSVWGARHLTVVAAPALLLAGLALARLRPYWLKTTALLLLSCWLLIAAASVWLRRESAYVWCAWEGLAASVARDERGADAASEVYAFEDLVAYHLWFALAETDGFHVSVVRGWPGVADDPAYFLPRRFAGVSVADAGALSGESFWVAFRAPALDESRPPLDALRARGYRVARVYERDAQGQRAFLIRLVKQHF